MEGSSPTTPPVKSHPDSHSCTTDQSKISCASVLFMVLYISTGGGGVKIGIGNISNMDVGYIAGGIGVGNNCNVNGEPCVSYGWEGA